MKVAAAVLKLAVIALPVVVYLLAAQSRVHEAVALGDLERTRAALKPWKHIDAMDRSGHTPLALAVAKKHNEIAQFLIQRGANPLPAAVESDYQQPLWLIASNRNAELTRALLAQGIDANATLKSGKTWLGAAVEMRDPASVDALLEAGANPNAGWGAQEGGYAAATPLTIALGGYGEQDIDVGLALAERLVAGGARISGEDPALRKTVNSVLFAKRHDTGAAIGFGRLKFLVERGYPLEASKPRDALLSQAAYSGNLEAVRYLLSKGADPMGGAKPCRAEKCPIDGAPLHRVAERPPMPALADADRAIAAALIAAGADADSPDQYGRTPRQLAERSKNTAVAEVVRGSGASIAERDAVPERTARGVSAVEAPPPPLYAGHPADPKGSDHRALLSAAGTELHAVVAYRGKRAEKSNVAEIEVTAQGKALTLFLTAYETTEWRVRVVPGAAVAKIVAIGHEPQRVIGLPERAQLVVRSAQQHGGGRMERVHYSAEREELRRVVDRITEMAGVVPKTMIARKEIGAVVIDGVTTDVELAPRSAGPPSAVTFVADRSNGKLSDDKLTAFYCCSGASSTVLASRGYRAGKRYFEAKLQLPFLSRHPERWTNIGIVADESASLSEGSNAFIGFAKHDQYRDGDVFGVAVDFDERVAYFSVNGKWISGEPGSGKGMKLPGRGELFAAVSVASGRDAWIANFGAHPFKHPLPSGYLPYAAP